MPPKKQDLLKVTRFNNRSLSLEICRLSRLPSPCLAAGCCYCFTFGVFATILSFICNTPAQYLQKYSPSFVTSPHNTYKKYSPSFAILAHKILTKNTLKYSPSLETLFADPGWLQVYFQQHSKSLLLSQIKVTSSLELHASEI